MMQEVMRYHQDVVRLTLRHSTGPRTKLLEGGLIIFQSGVAPGERCGVALLIAFQFCLCTLGFTPVKERAASLQL